MIEDRMGRAYDAIARAYAERNAAMPAVLVDLGHRVLALAGSRPRLLDVGCGAGRDAAWLERRGARVTGIDLSRGMLAEARVRVRGDLARMDMRTLAFSDGCFDAAWCMASLLHLAIADAPGALAEVRRVLRPGGVLALGLQEGAGEGWEPVPYRPDVERFFARYGEDEAEAVLLRSGFAVLDRGREEGGSRRWLRFLATVPGVLADRP